MKTEMKATLEVINKMQAAGVITRYAIGGAVGAIYYLEAISTQDIDIFVSIHPPEGKLIVTMEPLYNYLRLLGYDFNEKSASLMIEGWPVEFLPADDPLYNDALLSAIEVEMDGTQTWVMTQEHLMAIALKTGRAKDFARIEQFISLAAFDHDYLKEILHKHHLLLPWEAYNRKKQA